MKCKKNEVIMQADITVRSRDYRGRVLKRTNAESHCEKMLASVFKAFVLNFGRRLSVNWEGNVTVLPRGR